MVGVNRPVMILHLELYDKLSSAPVKKYIHLHMQKSFIQQVLIEQLLGVKKYHANHTMKK